MDSDPSSASEQPKKGLSSISPPSGRFIARRFLLPGLIVLVSVLLLMMFLHLFGGSRTAEQYLRQLDSDNPDTRWRAASDLARSIDRGESLALRADPDFAVQIAERLRRAVEELDKQQPGKNLTAEEAKVVRINSNPQREYIVFLTGTAAKLHTPVAIPELCHLAQRPDDGSDRDGVYHLPREALWALGNLGHNLRSFSSLSAEHRTHILDRLAQLAQSKETPTSGWARTALYYLDRTLLEMLSADSRDVVKVDSILAKCAELDDSSTRGVVALDLRFWDGDLIEETAVKLANDDDWRVRYQAVRTLADRGSSKVRWGIYRELLDEQRQSCNFREHVKDGREVIEESKARKLILRGLVDLATWHAKQDRSKTTPSLELLEVYDAVDKLAQSPVPELSNQAKETRATFFR